jgi:hypothetical protein
MLRWQGLSDTVVEAAVDKWDTEKYYKNDIFKSNLNNIRYVEIPDQPHRMNNIGFNILSEFLEYPNNL